ncbi:MAG: hypothetical protein R3Y23_00305, partial [Bacillota bacterium]
GMGYDAMVPNSVFIAGELGSLWGVSFSYFKGTKWLNAQDFIKEPPLYSAGDTNAKYRYMCHGNLMVSAVEYSKRATVLTLSSLAKMRIRVTLYPLSNINSTVDVVEGVVVGSANERAIIKGESNLTDNDIVFKDRYEIIYDDCDKKEHIACHIYSGGKGEFEKEQKAVTYECHLTEEHAKLTLYVVVGGKKDLEYVPDKEELHRGVVQAERNYTVSKVAGSGSLAHSAVDVSNNIIRHKTYNAMRQSFHYIENRAHANSNYNYEPTAAAIGGLLSTFVQDTSCDQLELYADETIIGALSTWISFCRTRDKRLLEEAVPKWKSALRASPDLVVSSPSTQREVAYKMTGSPLKEVSRAAIYPVDYNCYKIIALEIASKANRILGRKFDADNFAEIVAVYRKNLHKMCYNSALGIYMDRYVGGDFVGAYGATSLLPLVAGVVPNVDILSAMLLNIWDPKKLNVKYPIPTISATHPYYSLKRKKSDGRTVEAYNEYAGSVLPHLNYMAYLGAVRYGINDLSAHIATKSVDMWARYHEKYGCVPQELLPNFKFENDKQSDALSSGLMAVMGMQELIDVEYFNNDLRPALRFGTLASGEHKLVNTKIFDRNMSISIFDDVTTLSVDGHEVFEAIGGSVIVRNLTEELDGLSFFIYAKDNVTVSIASPVLLSGAGTDDTYRFNIQEGKSHVSIAKKRINITRA